MKHEYFGLWDAVAKCYAWVGESKNSATFARMCNVMAKDEKTFVGQANVQRNRTKNENN